MIKQIQHDNVLILIIIISRKRGFRKSCNGLFVCDYWKSNCIHHIAGFISIWYRVRLKHHKKSIIFYKFLFRNIAINICGLGGVVDQELLHNIANVNSGRSIFIPNTANAAELINQFSQKLEDVALLDVQVEYKSSQVSLYFC